MFVDLGEYWLYLCKMDIPGVVYGYPSVHGAVF